MQHHGASASHDCLDRSFRDPVVVMSTDSGIRGSLLEGRKLGCEGLRSKARTIVSMVLNGDHTYVTTHEFKAFLAGQRFV
jgi:hypothetical protein